MEAQAGSQELGTAAAPLGWGLQGWDLGTGPEAPSPGVRGCFPSLGLCSRREEGPLSLGILSQPTMLQFPSRGGPAAFLSIFSPKRGLSVGLLWDHAVYRQPGRGEIRGLPTKGRALRGDRVDPALLALRTSNAPGHSPKGPWDLIPSGCHCSALSLSHPELSQGAEGKHSDHSAPVK